MILGLAAAIIAALLQGVGSSAQALAAARANVPALLTPLYLLGMGMDGAGWLVSLVALNRLPLLAVEPVLASSLAITLVMNSVLLGVRLTRRGAGAVGTIIVSVAVLAMAGLPGPVPSPPSWVVTSLWVSCLVLVVASVLGQLRRWSTAMGIIGGLGFAGSSIAARGLDYTGWGVLTQPQLWLMLVFAAVGTVAFARGLEVAGPTGATRVTSWMWSMELTVPSVVGLLWLGDQVRPGWGIATVIAFPVALAATVAISTRGAVEQTRSFAASDRAAG